MNTMRIMSEKGLVGGWVGCRGGGCAGSMDPHNRLGEIELTLDYIIRTDKLPGWCSSTGRRTATPARNDHAGVQTVNDGDGSRLSVAGGASAVRACKSSVRAYFTRYTPETTEPTDQPNRRLSRRRRRPRHRHHRRT